MKDRLFDIDFSQLYIEQKIASSFKPKTKDEWDAKAKELDSRIHQSIYNEQFLASVDVSGKTTLLDVGCGPGNLALRFAKKLDTVYAMDYSTEMLECVKRNCEVKKIDNIKTIQASWDDDWIDIPNADIVIASRSMEVTDVKSALLKLNEKANKAVYLSYKVGGSFIDPKIFDLLNRSYAPKPDYIYLVMVLYQLGIKAEVKFLESESRKKSFKDASEFIGSIKWSLGSLSENEEEILTKAFSDGYDLSVEDSLSWALISWKI